MEIKAEIHTADEGRSMTRTVALIAILLSLFMAVQKIKSENVVLRIQQLRLDLASTNAKANVARLDFELAMSDTVVAQLLLRVPDIDASAVREQVAKAVARRDRAAAAETQERAQAQRLEHDVERWMHIYHEYDVAEALLALAIGVTAISLLIGSWAVLSIAVGLGVAGMALGTMLMTGLEALVPKWIISLMTV